MTTGSRCELNGAGLAVLNARAIPGIQGRSTTTKAGLTVRAAGSGLGQNIPTSLRDARSSNHGDVAGMGLGVARSYGYGWGHVVRSQI